MTSKSEKDRAKQIQDKCQSLLTSMLRDEDNKYCVDCDSKGPRWASWNLGVFLCIRCAGIHRNLGVHISRVKSVNLDTWTPEQVVSLQQMGNSRARAVYEALLPDGFRRPQTDSSLEAFVRAKYEQKKYLAREWVQPPPPKVDWDKEIDEELEKQKKKKKSTSSSLSNSNSTSVPKPKSDTIPQLLPKPNAKVNASPVSARSNDRNKTATASADLLGLDTKPSGFSEDFSGFLSAEPTKVETKAPETKTDTLKAEEESFFNQPAPTEKEKAKLTKDSILALYDTAPLNNTQFQSNPMSFGNFPAQNVGQFPQTQQPIHPNAFVGNQSGFPMNSANQFYPKNNFQQFNNQQQQPQQFPLHQQLNTFQQAPAAQNQLHNFSQFPVNSNVPYVQADGMKFQQNGSNFALNNAFLPNGSNLVQSSYPQNNGVQMNGAMHNNSTAFVTEQNFGQPNPYFGLSQQFGNMSVNSQNQFGNAGNIWQ